MGLFLGTKGTCRAAHPPFGLSEQAAMVLVGIVVVVMLPAIEVLRFELRVSVGGRVTP